MPDVSAVAAENLVLEEVVVGGSRQRQIYLVVLVLHRAAANTYLPVRTGGPYVETFTPSLGSSIP